MLLFRGSYRLLRAVWLTLGWSGFLFFRPHGSPGAAERRTMTLIWLIVWLCYSTPSVHAWNAWLIALLACAFCDLLGGSSVVS